MKRKTSPRQHGAPKTIRVRHFVNNAATLHTHSHAFTRRGVPMVVHVEVFLDYYRAYNCRFRSQATERTPDRAGIREVVTLDANEFGRAGQTLYAIGNAMCKLLQDLSIKPGDCVTTLHETLGRAYFAHGWEEGHEKGRNECSGPRQWHADNTSDGRDPLGRVWRGREDGGGLRPDPLNRKPGQY